MCLSVCLSQNETGRICNRSARAVQSCRVGLCHSKHQTPTPRGWCPVLWAGAAPAVTVTEGGAGTHTRQRRMDTDGPSAMPHYGAGRRSLMLIPWAEGSRGLEPLWPKPVELPPALPRVDRVDDGASVTEGTPMGRGASPRGSSADRSRSRTELTSCGTPLRVSVCYCKAAAAAAAAAAYLTELA